MYKNLYTLSNKYKNYKIVVYGVNRTSVNLFTDLALNHSIDVYAFFDMDNRFIGESFVNRPIINISQLKELSHSILIISEINEKQDLQKSIGQDVDILYKDEILDLNEELSKEKIYLYGIGGNGGKIYDILQNKGIAIEGVCVTALGRIEEWCGKTVLPVKQIKQENNCAIIVASDIESNIKEMLDQLNYYNMDKYIFYFMSKNVISNMNFFQVINLALYKKKNLWLYNKGDEYAQYLKKIFWKYQIDIERDL